MALFKVPLMVGRRFLSSLKKTGGNITINNKKKNTTAAVVVEKGTIGDDEVVKDVIVSKKSFEEGEEEEDINECINGHLFGGLEAERVWLEIYQVGNWGFGRVSFSGVKGEVLI